MLNNISHEKDANFKNETSLHTLKMCKMKKIDDTKVCFYSIKSNCSTAGGTVNC